MASNDSALIALGGNALILPGEKGYIGEQFRHTDSCMKPIAKLISQGMKIVITHGNGPIVGNILLRNECAKDYIPPMPLYICVADSQGGIGAMMAESLNKELGKLGVKKTISVVITHVLVDKKDPAFKKPEKPVGPYYSHDDAKGYIKKGWKMREIPGRGWRRLVASPGPKKIVEIGAIQKLFREGIIPIASGGGGVPVIKERAGFKGLDAVIDKDLSASLLANELSLKRFIILTDIDAVYLEYEKKSKRRLKKLTVRDAKKFLKQGQFPSGSMGPKIEAAIEFLESGGKEVIIASPEKLIDALKGKSGTRISI